MRSPFALTLLVVVACTPEPPPLPAAPQAVPLYTPSWAFEPWISKDISDGADTRAFLEGVRERDIPVGVVVLDSPWETNYNTFIPNEARYPNFAQMVQDFRDDDVRTVLWTTQMVNESSFDVEQGGDSYDGCNRAQTLAPAGLAANDGNHAQCPADGAFTSSGGNPDSRALLGKILRIDVDATTPAGSNELCASDGNGAAAYAIPSGNPFAGGTGGSGNCDEIWTYGLRNPFRIGIDRANGDLFIGDVGEGTMEEVDHIAAGSGGTNLGWDRCEGTEPTPGSGGCGGYTAPILTYTHASNGGPCSSITGGVRYRGAITELQGKYVYADYCSGRIHIATQGGSGWTSALWDTGPELNYTGFGEDEAGELYLTAINQDTVYRFVSGGTDPDLIFSDGFEG
jgi:hypothetical protein